MQEEGIEAPCSPPRDAIIHNPASFTTPLKQGIPSPAVNPPGAPKKRRNLSHWIKRPPNDSDALRKYLLSLPLGAPEERRRERASQRTLTWQFEQVQLAKGVAVSRDQEVTSRRSTLNLVPQLAADGSLPAAQQEQRCHPHTCPLGLCLSCGTRHCPSATMLGPHGMFMEETTASAPLPQASHDQSTEADDSSSSSPLRVKRRCLSEGRDGESVKRIRTLSQQCEASNLFPASPPPPTTPRQAALAVFAGEGELLRTPFQGATSP